MPPITEDQTERVRALVAAIPPGQVATYGDIAAAAELSSPRIVAWIMRTDSA
ncbi:MAG: MGMT family protein, partial [Mycobacterium sp.]|nr:MGMT family protein [Mycobacterium sp.]